MEFVQVADGNFPVCMWTVYSLDGSRNNNHSGVGTTGAPGAGGALYILVKV